MSVYRALGVFALLFSAHFLDAHLPTKKDTIFHSSRIEKLLEEEKITAPECMTLREGGFAYVFHPKVASWLEKPLLVREIQKIKKALQPHLAISLTKEGFSSASTRRSEEEIDSTNYSAVWVRDSIWHYYGLKLQDPESARRLLLRLLDFYANEQQIFRFLRVIEDPKIADPKHNPNAYMDVPLIRFSSKTLSHQQVGGEDQKWNHIQMDSHGLFLLALADAFESKLITDEDLEKEHIEVLTLFPAFFVATGYHEKKDAGPWEEELLLNSSSAGLIAAGQKRIFDMIQKEPLIKRRFQYTLTQMPRMRKEYKKPYFMERIRSSFSSKAIDEIYTLGMQRVEKNLSLGGEAPDYNGDGLDRGADAALLFLCAIEHTPYYKNPQRIKQILNLNQCLIGPYGIYRYKRDAYQACNYWIMHEKKQRIFGKPSPEMHFLNRFNKGYMPHEQPNDAQWFFDSIFATVYYRLALLQKENAYYHLRKADLHLKRSLAQLTGPEQYSANGEKLPEFSLPESINTIRDQEGHLHPIPSPICPLGWAQASLQMALNLAEKTHQRIGNP